MPMNLTRRELEVVRLVLDGYSNPEIARALNLAENTIKHHMSSIFDKTGVSKRVELAVLVMHHKLLEAHEPVNTEAITRRMQISGKIIELFERENVSPIEAQHILRHTLGKPRSTRQTA